MIAVGLAAIASLLVAADDETVVRAARVAPPTTQSIDTDDGLSDLLAAPGVSLTRDGGPLAPARAALRGLAGPRLTVDVVGVAAADPASGAVDVAGLPLSLGSAMLDSDAGFAGALSIATAPTSRLRLAVGDLATLSVGGRGIIDLEGGRATAAVDAGLTRGDFSFQAPAGALLSRDNNDQRRLQAAVVVDSAGPSGDGALATRVVAFGAAHEGGVPGFFTAPLTVRGERRQGGVGIAVAQRSERRTLGARASASATDRATRDLQGLQPDAHVLAIAGGLGLEARERIVLTHFGQLDISGTVDFLAAEVDGAAQAARATANAALSADLRLESHSDLQPSLRVSLGGAGVLDQGDDAPQDPALLPQLSARAALSRGTAVAHALLRHAQRAPTLDERFAPTGFIVAAPDLLPERDTLLEVGLAVGAPGARARVAAFASRLDEAIVVVNHNAFQVAPRNTGPATRAGVELAAELAPVALVRVDLAAATLWSHVEATAAPLPTAPPWTLRAGATLGDDSAFARAIVVGRGPSPSTIFGTLLSTPTALVDLRARLPLSPPSAPAGLGVLLSVDNAFDLRGATDQNLLPLPGRLIFLSLEVRT